MKKIIAVMLCAAMMISMAACQKNEENKTDENISSQSSVEIKNPFVGYDTIADAEKITGFGFTVPETIENYGNAQISVMNNEMIQVIFKNENGDMITFRKAKGSDDISGDYNNYTEEKLITVDEKSVTVKGNEGKINLAVWTEDDFTYSVSASGIPEEEITEFVKMCK